MMRQYESILKPSVTAPAELGLTGPGKTPKVVRFALTTKEPVRGKGSKFHEQISRMTIYLHDIRHPRDAILDSGASVSVVGQSQIRDIPHRLLSSGNRRILGMQEHSLPVVGKVNFLVRLGQRMWEHIFFVLDDSKCKVHNVILGTDFGEKAGLVLDSTDHRVYYKDTYLMMSALDGGYTPPADEGKVRKSVEVREVNLPENDLTAIGDLRDEREAVVNLLVRIDEPIRLPGWMAVKAHFEPRVCEETVVLVEPTSDLLEKHGVCLAKGLVPLRPETCDGQLIMANTTDRDVWL